MRFRTVLSLATLFLFCFTLAAWSIPLPAQPVANHLRSAPDNQSASGKISAVGDAAFSLEVLKDQDVNTIQFLVDGNTKVEGKLTVGAQATVEYGSNGGKNIAVHVVVSQPSGIRPY